MPEYGRTIQQMVDYCKTIEDRAKRQYCAETIVRIMEGMINTDLTGADLQAKLWNHLAAIADYELDIDYPVGIERTDETAKPKRIEYPQHKIGLRHYGSIVENFTRFIADSSNESENMALAELIANHMKRDLSNWNVDSMSDQKVADDLAALTDGKAVIDLNKTKLTSDGELLSTLVATTVKKKKRK